MKKEAILKACEDVFSSFNALENMYDSDLCLDGTLTGFIDEFVPFPEDETAQNDWENMVYVAFSLGFAIGQDVDLQSSALLKMKETLKKERLLPYFPREKKASPGLQRAAKERRRP